MSKAITFKEFLADSEGKKLYKNYTEQWLVTYRIEEDGTWVKKEDYYCTIMKGRNAAQAVKSRFKKDSPKAEVINIKLA